MKKCPFCSEEIQGTVVKCHYCGEWLDKKSQRDIKSQEISNKIKLQEIWDTYWVYIICIPIIIIAAGFLFMSHEPNFNRSAEQGTEFVAQSVEAPSPAPPLVQTTPTAPIAQPVINSERKGAGKDIYTILGELTDENFKKFVDKHGGEVPGIGYAINGQGRMTRMIERPSDNNNDIDLSGMPVSAAAQLINAMAGRSRDDRPDDTYTTPSYSIPNYNNTYTTPSYSHRQSEDEDEYTRSSGAINVQNGQYYPPVAGGAIDPRTGTFFPDVGGGYVDPRTGEFMPKIGP